MLDVSLQPGKYQVTLTANDGRGGVTSDGGLVEIQADKPPTLSLSLSPDTINVNGSSHKCVHDSAPSRSATPWKEAADVLVPANQR